MKILHSADWHIGNFQGPEREGKNLRSLDTLRCIRHLVDVAKEEKPEMVIIAGDLFHDAKVWASRGLSEVQEATKASDIQEERYFKSFFYEDLDIILKSIKESHANNKKDTSVQAKTIPFPEELIESLVLSAMRQGGSREEQTVLALNELGGNLGFLGELGENPLFLGVSAGSKEEKKEAVDNVKKGNKQWGKQ